MDLFGRLEKTANEAYPEEGRIERGLLADATIGAGIGGHFAKKHNALGINEDDSHAVANAKAGGIGGAVGAGLYGAGVGGMMGGGRGAALGAGAGAVGGGIAGLVNGAGVGYLHDKYDERLRAGAQEEQTASELMDSLEKIANEAYPEEGRIERGLLADATIGAGIPGHYIKKHNALGVNEDDSHTVANAKIGAGGGALGGAAFGGLYGAAGAHMQGKRMAPAAALAAGLGAASYGVQGAIGGAITGMAHDKYDDHLRSGAKGVSHNEAGMDQTASELMDSLEKTAANVFGNVKKTLKDAKGTDYKNAKKDHANTKDGFDRANTVDGFKANVKGTGGDVSRVRQNMEGLEKDVKNSADKMNAAKKTRNQARGQVAKGTALLGGSAAAGAGANEALNDKTASEEFMTGIFKEAATAILSDSMPEAKTYVDPIDKISFNR